ncbi:tyrosine-type recombinase/integrase [Microcoleus sp. D2_18a_B4]|uniref:tyrosine-type recombinase/integrase n=1 Tax=Microcoleus sp. D2_18a_B4 TaxID=3055329 RepID=UPI002FD04CF9
MFINQDNTKDGVVAKYGKVSVERFQGSYRIRWRFNGQRYVITVGKADTDTTLKVASAKAQEINSDILMERFDESLAKYSPKHAQALAPVQRVTKLNLADVWEHYKEANLQRVAKTTQKKDWKEVERCLTKVSSEALDLDNPHLLLQELLEHYSSSTLKKAIANINAACNYSVETKLISDNPYHNLKKQLPKGQKSKRSKECFEPEEVKSIIQSFSSNEFCSPASAYSHSYYSGYVEFLALTGFRPEEAIALNWNDIKERKGRTVIVVSKAYSKGELKDTKTYNTRIFPCNDQLLSLLRRIPKRQNENNLIFPSVEGGYLNQDNFLNRQWRPVVIKLYQSGKISQYLPCYNLRHSFITRLIRDGYDPSTVAALVGNSPQVILDHYLAAKKDLTLPEL